MRVIFLVKWSNSRIVFFFFFWGTGDKVSINLRQLALLTSCLAHGWLLFSERPICSSSGVWKTTNRKTIITTVYILLLLRTGGYHIVCFFYCSENVEKIPKRRKPRSCFWWLLTGTFMSRSAERETLATQSSAMDTGSAAFLGRWYIRREKRFDLQFSVFRGSEKQQNRVSYEATTSLMAPKPIPGRDIYIYYIYNIYTYTAPTPSSFLRKIDANFLGVQEQSRPKNLDSRSSFVF